MQSWKFHTDTTWTVAMAWLQTIWRGAANLNWWPDLAWPCSKKKIQNIGDECPLQFRKFQLAISSRLAMAHKNLRGMVLLKPPPLSQERGYAVASCWNRGTLGLEALSRRVPHRRCSLRPHITCFFTPSYSGCALFLKPRLYFEVFSIFGSLVRWETVSLILQYWRLWK